MSKRILLIGSGGHCHSVLDSVISGGDYDEIGVVARDAETLETLRADKLIADRLVGTDDDLPRLFAAGWEYAVITLGSVGNTAGRRKIFEILTRIGFSLPPVIDPSAIVAEASRIDPGVYVGKRAVVNAGSVIGTAAIINTGAIIEHDCTVGNFSHISTGAVLCGQVSVGDDTHIGAGSVVRQSIRIGCNALVGAGSVVVRDIPACVVAYGNPCRVIEQEGK